jgi:nicotinate phosphoribosyltransferase
MSFESELESFRAWDEVFPGSTILIDTYDVTRAAEMLVKYNIKPNDVRIDSDPLDEYAIEVRAIFDSAGWNDVGIFISGDLTPEVLRDYEDRGVPFTKCMAGSKYLNNGWGNDCNCGFVYKIVEYINENGNRVLPVKLSTGKRSYPGLKRFDNVAGEIQVSIGEGTGLDMSALRNQVTLDTPMELVTENK